MERAPTASEYRLLVEHLPVMIWRSGLDANCDYFNGTWLAFTGRTLEEEVGTGWTEGVHPQDFDRCVSYYCDHFQRREAFEMEYRLRRHDGEYRWIFDRGAPFTDDAGTFAGFIGSCVDVDERHGAQEAQQQHNEQQLALAREFEKCILAIVSHDIRNPLHSIQLAVHGLKLLPDPSGSVNKQVDIVTRGVNRIQHIVADLLDLSRERQGAGISVVAQKVDLRAVCRQVIDELAGIAQARITFDCEIEGLGTWDEHRILQAVSNLVSNAVQHSTPDSPVRVRITGNEQRVAVEVNNQGAIPSEILPRIFEPFRTGRQHENRGDGLGLGLFIAKAIARAHGGDLEVYSAEGMTTSRLVLPRSMPVDVVR